MSETEGTRRERRVPSAFPVPDATPAPPSAEPRQSLTQPVAAPLAEGGAQAGGATRPVADAVLPSVQPGFPAREFEVSMDTGQLRSLSTGQLLTVHRPALPDATPIDEEAEQRKVYSVVALVLGVLGLVASLFVGWMLPLPVAAIVFGVLSLRREEDARARAFVAIAAGIAGTVFSAVWIGYYAIIFEALPR